MRLLHSFLFIAVCTFSLFASPPLPSQFYFVPNEGQWDGNFAFKYDGNGTTCFLTSSGLTIDLHQVDRPPSNGIPSSFSPSPFTCHPDGTPEGSRARTVKGHVLRLSFLNANTPTLIGEDLQSSYSNYFLSRDSCRWRSRVPHYGKVIAKDVWPGIDVEYRIGAVAAHGSASSGVELIYHLHPFANPAHIQLKYEGQDAPIFVDANGSLLLQTSLGQVKEKAPFAYQILNHQQTEIPCRFELLDSQSYRVVLGPYDATQEVVIDPLIYGSYWGANGSDNINMICMDHAGNKLVSGGVSGRDFPITPGAYSDTTSEESGGGFITKFNASGDSVLFSTFTASGGAQEIACDAENRIYTAGGGGLISTYPLTPDAFDTTSTGGEGGLVRYSADGTTLEFCSYIGGSGFDHVYYMALDSLGDVYLYGQTRSTDFPVTPNALYPTFSESRNGFIAQFHPATSALVYSTYFGTRPFGPHCDFFGSGNMVLEPHGRVWFAGSALGDSMPVTPNALVPQHFPDNPEMPQEMVYFGCLALPYDSTGDLTRPPDAIPEKFGLMCYPNPFNPTTTLFFTLPSSLPVKLQVFDVLGRSVYQKSLGRLSVGEHHFQFDGTDLPSGIYFAHLSTPAHSHVTKLILLR